MKKFYLFLIALVALSAQSWASISYTYQGKTLYYIIHSSAGTATVTYQNTSSPRYTNLTGSLTIPSSITYNGTTYTVTAIDEYAFAECSGLTSVTIPNSVTSIGRGAFCGCSGLTGSLTIPNSVTSIGVQAFHGCSGLTGSLTIPNSVTSIGGQAFQGCSGLTSVTIPNSVTSIGTWAFYGCSGLSSIVVASGNSKYDSRNNCNAIIETSTNTLVTGCNNTIIPNSVTSIGEYAFYGCTGLTGTLTIPNSVTSIGSCAFYGCSSLTSVTIGNSVTSIGGGAFTNCTGLTTVNFNATNCTRGSNSSNPPTSNTIFEGCTAFSTLNIGNNVTKIPCGTFCRCALSGNITIPNSVTSIENYAFYQCSNVTSVTIGTGVGSIGYGAFSDCTSLSTINYNAVNCNINIPTYNVSYYFPVGNCPLSRVFIGENVQKIPDYAFIASYPSYDGSIHPTEAHFLCFQAPTMNYGDSHTDPRSNPGCGLLWRLHSDVTFYVPCGAAINYSRYASYCKEIIEDCGGGTQAIDDIIGNDTKIFSRGGDIVIESSDNTDALVYDIKGRIIYHGRIESPIHVNQSGVYMVKLGNSKPQKVVVNR